MSLQSLKQQTLAILLPAAVGAVAIVIVTTLILASGGQGAPAYAAGRDSILPSEVLGGRPITVAIFGRSSCGVCQAFKAELAQLVKETTTIAKDAVVFVVPSVPEPADFLLAAEIGISRERTFYVDARRLRLHVVPTVMVVGPSGVIIYVQEGRPQGSDRASFQPAVLEAIRVGQQR